MVKGSRKETTKGGVIMQAKDLVLKARDEYIATSQDEQFKKAYEKVEELKRVIPEEDEEQDKKSLTPKAFNPDDHLVNYVMNKLLEVARKEGGNMFMGDSSYMNQFIFEFYTDYDQLAKTNQFMDNWSMYIRGVSNTPAKKKKEETSDTSQSVDVEAIKKEAIKEYKEQEAKKKEEAKAKAEAEKEAKRKALEEAKKKEEEEANQNLGGLFDLL